MELSIPRFCIGILIFWYEKCFGVVRYDNYLSSRFHVCAGVRQGGVLSPVLFGLTENAGHELAGHENAVHEIARHDKCRMKILY